MNLRLQNVTQSTLFHEVLESAEITIISPVYTIHLSVRPSGENVLGAFPTTGIVILTVEDCKDFALVLGQFDESRSFGT